MATELNLAQYQKSLELARKRGTGTIRRGSGNREAVKAIQDRLSQLGYAVQNDGVFGEETDKALRDFQKSRNAKVDGILGPETLGKLLRSHKAKPNAADTGLDAVVKVVESGVAQPQSQTGLGRIRATQRGGGAGGATGGRGKAAKIPKGPHGGTLDAQGNEIATAKTGPIGSTTPQAPGAASWEKGGAAPHQQGQAQPTQPQDNNPEFNKLHPREGGKFAAKQGDSGEQVQNTQVALNKVNRAGLVTDGQFGPKTNKAVRGFQKAAGLTVDGIVGPRTAASLRRRLRLVKRVNNVTGATRA